ncbi:response regulator transcription factor [Pedobacter chitinilyticus]|uniref:Response regulator transcription factor n=1 Tax=Pedobacter chitinilyticus TaxID=2233776 RepID=A0A3S3PC32_9SPHI|nr:response regulator transcription factor [Pedobacter chitinilyticus]RWU08157.1 response regulator transcription factor [Pedobacter chitinilyticus]
MNLWDTIKVAFVDDHPVVLSSVANYLNSKGNIRVVLETDDGSKLIKYLQEHVPVPNICVLDVSMPLVDGITLLKEIKTRWPGMPCLMYSQQPSEITITKSIFYGANGYLTKDHKLEELYQAIVSIADTGWAYTSNAGQELFDEVLKGSIEVQVLTDRERQFIKLYAGSDLTYEDVGTQMGLTASRAKKVQVSCYKKLKVSSKGKLTLRAIQLGIINL